MIILSRIILFKKLYIFFHMVIHGIALLFVFPADLFKKEG